MFIKSRPRGNTLPSHILPLWPRRTRADSTAAAILHILVELRVQGLLDGAEHIPVPQPDLRLSRSNLYRLYVIL